MSIFYQQILKYLSIAIRCPSQMASKLVCNVTKIHDDKKARVENYQYDSQIIFISIPIYYRFLNGIVLHYNL